LDDKNRFGMQEMCASPYNIPSAILCHYKNIVILGV